MMSKYLQDKRDEEGFTLIELLVVVIIIGILAAIAIPTFLNQRKSGWQAEVVSTVRNVALEVEAEATNAGGTYAGIDQAKVTAFADTIQGTDKPVTIKLVEADANKFALCGSHSQTGVKTSRYVSASGGMQKPSDTAC
jgi:type IV pilus assembly protein PilA